MNKIIKNRSVLNSYLTLTENRTIEESNYIILNSLAILGDKKVVVEYTSELSKEALNRINRYKYPNRLASFLNITNERTESWKDISFAKIALK